MLLIKKNLCSNQNDDCKDSQLRSKRSLSRETHSSNTLCIEANLKVHATKKQFSLSLFQKTGSLYWKLLPFQQKNLHISDNNG